MNPWLIDCQKGQPQESIIHPLLRNVVDDHHHVLPEIHLAIRQRKLAFKEICIVHFDAHPDLCVTDQMHADVVFKPHELYQHLDDSSGGIAEFILPLVYAGHVNQVIWVKPPWSTQFELGRHAFHVGKSIENGHLRVTSPCSYYTDDDSYAPLNEIEAEKEIILDVMDDRGKFETKSVNIVLDICLDYFTTNNPFLQELIDRIGLQNAQIVSEIYSQLKCKDEDRILFNHPTETSMENLYPLFKDSNGIEKTLQLFIELINSLSKDDVELIQDKGPDLDLPMHKSSREEMDQMLIGFRNFITQHLSTEDMRPKVVTIAKSVGDGFTPEQDASYLLDQVMGILQDVFN